MINKSNEKEEKYKFRSLTSYKKVEIQPVTLQALEYVISDKSEPTNVAITGNYGAGKSSVIETFELGKKDKKFIHISLAQYDETIKNEEKGLNNRQINTIEGIVNNNDFNQKMAEYLHSKRLISSKSIQQQGIRLNGFKEVQIEYE